MPKVTDVTVQVALGVDRLAQEARKIGEALLELAEKLEQDDGK